MVSIQIGDWVNGKSKLGELFRGFVEEIDDSQGTVKVRVIDCDNEESIGKTIETLAKWIRTLSDSDIILEGQVQYLIDLALETRDRDWFYELSTKLHILRNERKGNNEVPFTNVSYSNRFCRYGIKE